jgi:hypothetical protein
MRDHPRKHPSDNLNRKRERPDSRESSQERLERVRRDSRRFERFTQTEDSDHVYTYDNNHAFHITFNKQSRTCYITDINTHAIPISTEGILPSTSGPYAAIYDQIAQSVSIYDLRGGGVRQISYMQNVDRNHVTLLASEGVRVQDAPNTNVAGSQDMSSSKEIEDPRSKNKQRHPINTRITFESRGLTLHPSQEAYDHGVRTHKVDLPRIQQPQNEPPSSPENTQAESADQQEVPYHHQQEERSQQRKKKQGKDKQRQETPTNEQSNTDNLLTQQLSIQQELANRFNQRNVGSSYITTGEDLRLNYNDLTETNIPSHEISMYQTRPHLEATTLPTEASEDTNKHSQRNRRKHTTTEPIKRIQSPDGNHTYELPWNQSGKAIAQKINKDYPNQPHKHVKERQIIEIRAGKSSSLKNGWEVLCQSQEQLDQLKEFKEKNNQRVKKYYKGHQGERKEYSKNQYNKSWDEHNKSIFQRRNEASIDKYGKSLYQIENKASIDRYGKSIFQRRNEASIDEHGKSLYQRRNEASIDEHGKSLYQRRNEASIDRYGKSIFQRRNEASIDEHGKSLYQRRNEASIDEHGKSLYQRRKEASIDRYGKTTYQIENEASINKHGKSLYQRRKEAAIREGFPTFYAKLKAQALTSEFNSITNMLYQEAAKQDLSIPHSTLQSFESLLQTQNNLSNALQEQTRTQINEPANQEQSSLFPSIQLQQQIDDLDTQIDTLLQTNDEVTYLLDYFEKTYKP